MDRDRCPTIRADSRSAVGASAVRARSKAAARASPTDPLAHPLRRRDHPPRHRTRGRTRPRGGRRPSGDARAPGPRSSRANSVRRSEAGRRATCGFAPTPAPVLAAHVDRDVARRRARGSRRQSDRRASRGRRSRARPGGDPRSADDAVHLASRRARREGARVGDRNRAARGRAARRQRERRLRHRGPRRPARPGATSISRPNFRCGSARRAGCAATPR